jgi:hypothetical protein
METRRQWYKRIKGQPCTAKMAESKTSSAKGKLRDSVNLPRRNYKGCPSG